uniref:Nucleolar protein 16 n=2 Tax=Panagrolaimus TaxID=55784 RepID=A0A914QQT0_9BILA
MPKSYKRDRKGGGKLRTRTAAVRQKKKTLKKKQNSATHVKAISAEWDTKKSTKSNLESMGLVYNKNKAIPLPKTKFAAEMEAEKLADALSKGGINQQKAAKAHVAEALEVEAKTTEESKKKKKREPKLLPKDLQFCTEMLRRHGEDYDAMARDHLNIYQNSAAQIKRKLETFKRSKAYTQAAAEEETMEH